MIQSHVLQLSLARSHVEPPASCRRHRRPQRKTEVLQSIPPVSIWKWWRKTWFAASMRPGKSADQPCRLPPGAWRQPASRTETFVAANVD